LGEETGRAEARLGGEWGGGTGHSPAGSEAAGAVPVGEGAALGCFVFGCFTFAVRFRPRNGCMPNSASFSARMP